MSYWSDCGADLRHQRSECTSCTRSCSHLRMDLRFPSKVGSVSSAPLLKFFPLTLSQLLISAAFFRGSDAQGGRTTISMALIRLIFADCFISTLGASPRCLAYSNQNHHPRRMGRFHMEPTGTGLVRSFRQTFGRSILLFSYRCPICVVFPGHGYILTAQQLGGCLPREVWTRGSHRQNQFSSNRPFL